VAKNDSDPNFDSDFARKSVSDTDFFCRVWGISVYRH